MVGNVVTGDTGRHPNSSDDGNYCTLADLFAAAYREKGLTTSMAKAFSGTKLEDGGTSGSSNRQQGDNQEAEKVRGGIFLI